MCRGFSFLLLTGIEIEWKTVLGGFNFFHVLEGKKIAFMEIKLKI